MNSFQDYTVYQLMDEFNRYRLKMEYDIWIRFKCAGASGMKEPEDWLKDIHSKKIDNK